MPHLPPVLHPTHRQIGVIALGAAAALGIACYAYLRPKPDPLEIERRRRLFLAEHGRITDASLLDPRLGDAVPASALAGDLISQDAVPTLLLYHYRVAGVTYECAQDVSLLADYVRHLRMDLPIQVRYDPHNPTDSIVVAESWSGLRSDGFELQPEPLLPS